MMFKFPTQDHNKTYKMSLALGFVLLLVAALFLITNPNQFYRSYLSSYLVWLGVCLGSLSIAFLHQLSGGRWGTSLSPFLKTSIRVLPVMIVLFLPLVFGLDALYPWRTHSDLTPHKAFYLNTSFFLTRTILYFMIWLTLSRYFLARVNRLDMAFDEKAKVRLQKFSGAGLVLYFFTMTFASFDWLMSINPHWHSTLYGLIVIVGQILTAFAVGIAVLAFFYRNNPDLTTHDLGKLLLTFVMVWAYLSFSQLLIMWSANLPEEIPYYLTRLKTSWLWLAVGLILLHFFLPFFLLLSRSLKQDKNKLLAVALLVFVMRFVETFWLTAPEFYHSGFHVHALDFILPLALGFLWFGAFLRSYDKIKIENPLTTTP